MSGKLINLKKTSSAQWFISAIMALTWGVSLPILNFSGNAIALEPPSENETITAKSEATKILANRLIIRLTEKRVYAYHDDRIIASYPVAIGKKGWETPKGNFQVTQMVRNPVWQSPWTGKIVPPGEHNPLGERWIGFVNKGKNVIGFHGTKNENSLGKAASHGCIRMRNEDIKKLFDIVAIGTQVTVQN